MTKALKVIGAITLFSLFSSAAFAQTCVEKLSNPNWPNDKLEKVLTCTLIKTVTGVSQYSRPSLCFGVIKTSYSNYQDTWYKTYRSSADRPGAEVTIVVQDSNGNVKDGSVENKGSAFQIRSQNSSFEFGQKWIEETVVDLENPSKLQFNTYNVGFLTNQLKQSDEYHCQLSQ